LVAVDRLRHCLLRPNYPRVVLLAKFPESAAVREL
jgi:hypothetical protein